MLLSSLVRLVISTCVSLLSLCCFYEQINWLIDWLIEAGKEEGRKRTRCHTGISFFPHPDLPVANYAVWSQRQVCVDNLPTVIIVHEMEQPEFKPTTFSSQVRRSNHSRPIAQSRWLLRASIHNLAYSSSMSSPRCLRDLITVQPSRWSIHSFIYIGHSTLTISSLQSSAPDNIFRPSVWVLYKSVK